MCAETNLEKMFIGEQKMRSSANTKVLYLLDRGTSSNIVLHTYWTYLCMSAESRYKVKALYKTLLFLGRDWPQGYHNYFRPRLHAAFLKSADLKDEKDIANAIHRAEFMVKELETFWFLKKYRAVKRSYGSRSG
ncbi:Predicted protein [Taphrina deformans PYCC 5710]|uniref:Uncharacterized protein n=1 Tax=Taphrina deformans (strain PYCC 5710 / ATCC 11124 / CBS 356.35 / IMI 108563 / JCM 9778 / NBRC 8474) TaxID=1097556 RepID=R4XBY8_TAPDE|nr:Predicted protein [Taphrina deformans PYCC 5710]|eukprot:CCG83387.1 Predicted protein [Taphrina deformans PYCC 5710]